MADWAYNPEYSYPVERRGPASLITEFEDGTEMRRLKSTAVPYRVVEIYDVDRVTRDAMTAFYDARGLVTAFTKRTFLDAPPHTAEASFRFGAPLKDVYQMVDSYVLEIEFVRAL